VECIRPESNPGQHLALGELIVSIVVVVDPDHLAVKKCKFSSQAWFYQTDQPGRQHCSPCGRWGMRCTRNPIIAGDSTGSAAVCLFPCGNLGVHTIRELQSPCLITL